MSGAQTIANLKDFLQQHRIWISDISFHNIWDVTFNKYISSAELLSDDNITMVKIVFFDKEYKSVTLNMSFVKERNELEVYVNLGVNEQKTIKLSGLIPVKLQVKGNIATVGFREVKV